MGILGFLYLILACNNVAAHETTSSFSSSNQSPGKSSSILPVSAVASSSAVASLSSSVSTRRTTSKFSLTQIFPTTHAPNNSSSTSASRKPTTSTTSSAHPTNTTPCNGYPEFCNRKYSNITNVCAHNSAFVMKDSAASNQVLPVTVQLNDGVRMLQGETHWYNGTIRNCHTSCSLLDAGTFQSELETVAGWLRDNPYEVLTWLVVNSDFVPVQRYVPSIEASGIRDYLYIPEHVPQRRSQWPTLGQMILSGKRLVMFMDYNANQTAVPYILDEFTHMWETPFSPTDPSFPCTLQRPPNLQQNLTAARDEYMYIANHNLNTAIDLSALVGGSSGSSSSNPPQTLLIPNTAKINRTNGLYDTFGQMGAMSDKCTEKWSRPPNFLLVDYYNYGDPYQGSVFEVAARANGVKYNKNRCCGHTSISPAPSMPRPNLLATLGGLALGPLLAEYIGGTAP